MGRKEGTANVLLNTGNIEIEANSISILNKAKTPPFDIRDNVEVTEDLRMKYRYIDLRREKMADNMVLRHNVKKAFRDFLDNEDFIDVETPYLTKSTPEGARDYLVPSRVQQGK
ncbi:amino acid--tRNA ligase-related protein, partial [Salmonella enterica]|uniref:amino acid--tRNA ligase-related protein n=1 Tax=Salmonella enterica TaxID=28901 RepID=UPI00307727CE